MQRQTSHENISCSFAVADYELKLEPGPDEFAVCVKALESSIRSIPAGDMALIVGSLLGTIHDFEVNVELVSFVWLEAASHFRRYFAA